MTNVGCLGLKNKTKEQMLIERRLRCAKRNKKYFHGGLAIPSVSFPWGKGYFLRRLWWSGIVLQDVGKRLEVAIIILLV